MGFESIMEICSEALEQAGYIISDYSETYQKFTVSNGDKFVSVDFEEIGA